MKETFAALSGISGIISLIAGLVYLDGGLKSLTMIQASGVAFLMLFILAQTMHPSDNTETGVSSMPLLLVWATALIGLPIYGVGYAFGDNSLLSLLLVSVVFFAITTLGIAQVLIGKLISNPRLTFV